MPLAALLGSLGSGCANMQAPTGGPKDSLPPTLLKASPELNTTSFVAKIINLEFDEYVEIQNVFEKVIINPPAEKFPDITSKLRTVRIRLFDTLQPNTTYSLQFGDAIRDINEGNPLREFKYVFSTGGFLDSLELTGTVSDAETGKVDSTLIVVLHSNLTDSSVVKNKPRFVTRLDGKGNFSFTNLPAGTFNLFALKDNGFKRYTDSTESFAFVDTPIVIGAVNSPQELFTFREAKAEVKVSQPAAFAGKGKIEEALKLQYTTTLSGGQQEIIDPLEIRFTKPLAKWDTAKILLVDTLNKPAGPFTLTTDTSLTTLSLAYSWKENQPLKLILLKGFAADTSGATTAKNDTLSFITKRESDYGALKLKFTNLDLAGKPVLQWVQSDKIVLSVPLTTNEYRANLFKPGQYDLRILHDANGNGNWDTGNYRQKKQPEIVTRVEKQVNIKPNWENEIEVEL